MLPAVFPTHHFGPDDYTRTTHTIEGLHSPDETTGQTWDYMEVFPGILADMLCTQVFGTLSGLVDVPTPLAMWPCWQGRSPVDVLPLLGHLDSPCSSSMCHPWGGVQLQPE